MSNRPLSMQRVALQPQKQQQQLINYSTTFCLDLINEIMHLNKSRALAFQCRPAERLR